MYYLAHMFHNWIKILAISQHFRALLVTKNRRSILVAIFCWSISWDLTDVPPAQRPLPPSLSDHPVRPLCFAPLAAMHTAAGRTTQQYYQHNFLWSAPPVCYAVGNMVNTRGNHCHDRRTDDCCRLVYSPYNVDVHSPGKRPLCSICRQRWHARCCFCRWDGLGGMVVRHSIKLRCYVTTAAGKVAVNWIQPCC